MFNNLLSSAMAHYPCIRIVKPVNVDPKVIEDLECLKSLKGYEQFTEFRNIFTENTKFPDLSRYLMDNRTVLDENIRIPFEIPIKYRLQYPWSIKGVPLIRSFSEIISVLCRHHYNQKTRKISVISKEISSTNLNNKMNHGISKYRDPDCNVLTRIISVPGKGETFIVSGRIENIYQFYQTEKSRQNTKNIFDNALRYDIIPNPKGGLIFRIAVYENDIVDTISYDQILEFLFEHQDYEIQLGNLDKLLTRNKTNSDYVIKMNDLLSINFPFEAIVGERYYSMLHFYLC